MTTTPQAALLSARIKELAVQHLGTANFVGMGDFVEALAKLQATQAEPTERVTPDMLLHLQDQIKVLAEITATQAEPVQAGELPDERAAFEQWASDNGEFPRAVARSGDVYHLMATQTYWLAWQARAALSARKPLSEDDALELVSLHQKAVFELAKDMSDDNYQIVVQTRLALLNALRPERAHGIGLEVKP